MSYFFMIKMQKLKASDIRGIQIHNQGERMEQTISHNGCLNLNYDLVNEEKIDYLEAVEKRLDNVVFSKKKIRKDAVRLCEFLITSEKEFFDSISDKEKNRFFKKGLDFLQDKYGKENIIYANVHYYEKTPHMHVGFVPITEDFRLHANSIFTRLHLAMLQDDILNYMMEAGFDLKRSDSNKREYIYGL
ncbi:hypothetical protein CJ195_09385 [Bacillus sp. UMB0899]|uniref:MobV family relaxase n=1 Tax=Metabacillus schmidteae TaxID=2730405 RepID=UPI000C7FC18A|nr:MobV family relaxase [Metabacillus schmidteae]PMC38654.1 hypothetical protein CJ195_09385 [Bacillus sp. UMB0899]